MSDYVKRAILGTRDYHETMRGILFSPLMLAGNCAGKACDFDDFPVWLVNGHNSENRCLQTNKIGKFRAHYIFLIASEPICQVCLKQYLNVVLCGYTEAQIGVFFDGMFHYRDTCCLCGTKRNFLFK